MKFFWNIKRTFKKYTNICTFFECSFNILKKNIDSYLQNHRCFEISEMCAFVCSKQPDMASTSQILIQGGAVALITSHSHFVG